jgi:hypothetical protein
MRKTIKGGELIDYYFNNLLQIAIKRNMYLQLEINSNIKNTRLFLFPLYTFYALNTLKRSEQLLLNCIYY